MAGPPDEWELTLIVRPLDEPGEPAVFGDRFQTIEIPPNTRQQLTMTQSFASGPGRYQVDVRLIGQSGRICQTRLEVEAKRRKSERAIQLALEPGQVTASWLAIFRGHDRIERSPGDGLRVKVLLNMDVARRRRQVNVELYQFVPLLSTLRALSRNPEIHQFAVTAFSVEEQKLLFRQDYRSEVDFRAIGETLDAIKPGMVSIDNLGKNKDRDFLGEVIRAELQTDDQPDFIVIAGNESLLYRKIPGRNFDDVKGRIAPLYFINTSRHPLRGALGAAIRSLGGKEVDVRSPTELDKAVRRIVGTIEQQSASR